MNDKFQIQYYNCNHNKRKYGHYAYEYSSATNNIKKQTNYVEKKLKKNILYYWHYIYIYIYIYLNTETNNFVLKNIVMEFDESKSDYIVFGDNDENIGFY